MTIAPPTSIEINAKRDFGIIATLKQFDTATGKTVPRTTGDVKAFISATNAPSTAVPIDLTLQVDAEHIGNGKWTIAFDGTNLTDALLATLTNGVGFLMIVEDGDEWSYVKLNYVPTRQAVIGK